MKLNTVILETNPEFYTIWNYRREILVKQNQSLTIEEQKKKFEVEIKLVDSLLKAAPKSYWVWNHRRWILENGPTKLWEREFKVLDYMLDLDPRNFHGWDYRRYVVQTSSLVTPKQEFEYTTKKINQNFSNFSAWHYRSKVISAAFPDPNAFQEQITKDIELVRNAVFTEPSDQSAWFYQRFIFGKGLSF